MSALNINTELAKVSEDEKKNTTVQRKRVIMRIQCQTVAWKEWDEKSKWDKDGQEYAMECIRGDRASRIRKITKKTELKRRV